MLKNILVESWLVLLVLSGLGFLISILETLGIASFIPLFQTEGLSQYLVRAPAWIKGAFVFLMDSSLSHRIIILAILIFSCIFIKALLSPSKYSR
jgi:hypothetical protein